MSGISKEKTRHFGRMEETDRDWPLEVNMVAWNGGEPKVDIRPWSPDGERCGKGITLTVEEARWVAAMLAKV